MKLGSQLYVLIFIVVLYLFSVTLFNNVVSMKSYLDSQLVSNAKNGADHLSASLPPYINSPDKIEAKHIIDAVFNSSNFYSIEVLNIKGDILFERRASFELTDVPFWFLYFFKLSSPVGQSEIEKDLMIVGVVNVQSNPDKDYFFLWQHFKKTAWEGALQFLIILILVLIFIRSIKRALRSMEYQAVNVSKKEFASNNNKPISSDLIIIFDALNIMSNSIRCEFSEYIVQNNKIKYEYFIDYLTGLPNGFSANLYFDNHQFIRKKKEGRFLLFLITLPSLTKVNEVEGRNQGDDYIKRGVELVLAAMQDINDVVVFRLSGSQLCVSILDQICQPITIQKKLLEQFDKEKSTRYSDGFGHFVYFEVEPKDLFSKVLAYFEKGLAQKLFIPIEPTEIHHKLARSARSRLQWYTFLHQYIQADLVLGLNNKDDGFSHIDVKMFRKYTSNLTSVLKMNTQPIFDCELKTMYEEIFIIFRENENQVPIHDVLVASERLGLSKAMERTVFVYTLSELLVHPNKKVGYGIKISNTMLQDIQLIDWIIELLSHFKNELPELTFEINESGVLTSKPHTRFLIKQLKILNFNIVIDSFGSSFNSLKYIENMNIDGVKLDGLYIEDIINKCTQLYIQNTIDLCHLIGVFVIASHTESIESQSLCQTFNFDGVQGFTW